MDLDIQVSKLRVLKQSYLSEHYDLEDRVLKYYPQTIKEYEERIAGYENDVALAKQHKPQGEDKFCPMTLRTRIHSHSTPPESGPFSGPLHFFALQGSKILRLSDIL